MAHQPLIAASLLALGACNQTQEWDGTFDVPQAVDVLQPGEGPFDTPVGYAASLHGGRIALLSLRDRRYATDTPTASFLRAAPLATGAARVLGDLAVSAPGDGTVTVFAADRSQGHLLRIPHIVGLDADGRPLRVDVTASPPEFVDADASGDAATLVDLVALEGFAATEDWTVTFDGTGWIVRGSRSGRLETTAATGVAFRDEGGGLAFRIEGTATAGDHFTFSTDNGITEIDLGGVPLALEMSPDDRHLAAIVAGDGPTRLLWLDPTEGTVLGEVPLAPGARPNRLAWMDDGASLFVADAGLAVAWEVRPGPPDTVVAHDLPWPVVDVAPLAGATGRTLTVVPLDAGSVWVLDLDTGALRDLDPFEAGTNGIDFDTTVRGLGAIPEPFLWPQVDDDQVPVRGAAVAISLARGAVVFLGEPTGCLVADPLGPRTRTQPSVVGPSDYETDFGDAVGGPYLEPNGSNDRSVIVNRCAGNAWEERWTLRYDAIRQGWTVEGTRSGPMASLAYEDVRYVSDNGAISFTIRSGSVPSEDGWEIWFDVLPGVHQANGDNDGDGNRDLSFNLPADPVWFHQDIAVGSGGWAEVRRQPFVLVAASGSDLVGKVDPETGEVEAAFW